MINGLLAPGYVRFDGTKFVTDSTINLAGPAGPPGPPGLPGVAGVSGQNSFTTLLSTFIQPAINGTVTISVQESNWIATGQIIYISNAGYYSVSSVINSNTVIVVNIGYSVNVAPGLTAGSIGAEVSPAGPAGVSSFTAGGDLTGTSSSQTISKLQGNTLTLTGISNNQIIGINGGVIENITIGGDVSSSSGLSSLKVTKIQGTSVSSTAPTNNQVLQYSTSSSSYVPTTLPTGFTAGGDLTGSSTSQTVSYLQGHTLALAGLANNQVLGVTIPGIIENLTIGGDISANSGISSLLISKIQGNTVTLTSIANNQVLGVSSGTIENISIGGDISASSGIGSISVIKIQGIAVSSTVPTNNQVLQYSTSSSSYVPTTLPSGFTAGGDLSGSSTSQTVSELQGNILTLTSIANNQVLGVSSGAIKNITIGGDVSASNGIGSLSVIKIQGISVSSTAPTNNQVLQYSSASSSYVPTTLASGFTAGGDLTGTSTSQTVSYLQGNTLTLTGISNNQIIGISSGAIKNISIGGDISASSGIGSISVIKIQGFSVSATAPTNNQVLQYSTASSSYVPTTLTGTFTAGGDLTGSSTSQTVSKLQGNTLTLTSIANNQVIGVSGGVIENITIGGDVSASNGIGSLSVVKIQGTSVSSTAPTNNQVLQYSSASSSYVPVTLTGSFTPGGDLTGSSTSQTVSKLQGNTLTLTSIANNQVIGVSGGIIQNLTIGGDISATNGISSLQVAKLQGTTVSSTTPTSKQVFQYNGTSWGPSSSVLPARPASDSNTLLDYRFNEINFGILKNYGSYGNGSGNANTGPLPTTTTANFTQPTVQTSSAAPQTVNVSVASSSGYAVGQIVIIGTIGTFGTGGNYYYVYAVSTGVLTLLNIGTTGASSVGSTIPSGSTVTPTLDLLVQSGTCPSILNQGIYDYCHHFYGSPNNFWSNYSVGTTSTASTGGGCPDFVGITKISIHILVNPTKLNTTYAEVFGYSTTSNWSSPYQQLGTCIQFTNGGQGQWTLAGGNQSFTITGTNGPTHSTGYFGLNNWQLLSTTIDLTLSSNNVLYYKNGYLVGTASTSSTGSLAFGTNGYWFIGNPNDAGDTGDSYYGLLGMARFENTVRSASYIQNMWQTIIPSTTSWPMS